MVRQIVKDPVFLAQKSVESSPEDKQIAQDLIDTLLANRLHCVGMAANMIGELKRIIVFEQGEYPSVMYNPEILKASGSYMAEEGCLSLEGRKQVKRWKVIKVRYQNDDFQIRFKTFSDFTAQIIQHEIDHCNGVLI